MRLNQPTLLSTSLFLHSKAELSDTSAVLEAFKFIENAAAEFSDEDEEEDSEGKDRTHVESRTVRKHEPHTAKEKVVSFSVTNGPQFFTPDHQEEAAFIVVVTGQYGH